MSREVLSKPLVRAEHLVDLEVEAPEVPIAVDLGERAMALAAIMDYLNKANQVRGSRIQLENGGGAIKKRYGDHAAMVQLGAEKGRNELRAGFDDGIDTLIAADALRANGIDEADVEVAHISMQAALNREFGAGKAYARNRHAVVARARKAAGK
jgi:hypothetical protein